MIIDYTLGYVCLQGLFFKDYTNIDSWTITRDVIIKGGGIRWYLFLGIPDVYCAIDIDTKHRIKAHSRTTFQSPKHYMPGT